MKIPTICRYCGGVIRLVPARKIYGPSTDRLILCVESFDPAKGKLDQHIMCQLKYELLSCKDSRRRYGFTAAPYDLRGAVISLDAFQDSGSLCHEEPAAA